MNRNFLFFRRVLLLLALAVLMLFVGCSDDKSGSTTEPGTVERLYSYPEIQGCAFCHGPGGEAAQGPDLSTPALFQQNLVSKKSNNYPNWLIAGDCSTQPGMVFVKPGKPEESSLLAALILEYATSIPAVNNNCNSAYGFHSGGANATLDGNKALQEDLLLWINSGARP